MEDAGVVTILCYTIFFQFVSLSKLKLFMKKLLMGLLALALCPTSFAQAHLATAEYQKTMQPAVQADVPFPEKTVTKTIDEQMGKLGYKGNNTKGFLTYKGVHLAELGPDSYDLYFKTDRKSKNEKDATTITMMISSGYDKFIGDTTNAIVISNAKDYLNRFTEKVAAYDLEQQIADQEDAFKKATKKMNNLSDDAQSLQKKKTRIESDIADNIKAQAAQKSESDKQQQILDTLKGRRKQ